MPGSDCAPHAGSAASQSPTSGCGGWLRFRRVPVGVRYELKVPVGVSSAHHVRAFNLHKRIAAHEGIVPCFLREPEASFANNSSEPGMRMSKMRMKAPGCFRRPAYAEADAHIDS